jgi:hypothetical protein
MKSFYVLIPLALLAGCGQQSRDNSAKAADSAAQTMDDVADAIRKVKTVAANAEDISDRVKAIRGVEIGMTPEWEYQIIALDAEKTAALAKVNELGKEGWELAAPFGETNAHQYLFKRRKAIVLREKTNPESNTQPESRKSVPEEK